MDTYLAITTRRTIRLFDQKPIPSSLLERMINAARLSPSAANRQVLEYLVIQHADNRNKLFSSLKWAAAVYPKRNPAEGQKPTAYVIVLVRDAELNVMNASDAGAAMENMILTAWNEGVGSCWMGAIDRDKIRADFAIPQDYQIFGVLSLGYPAEEPALETVTDSVKYWLDDTNRLHVPKRRLSDVVHYETFEKQNDSCAKSK
jgi:nitroreductase